ncbi:low molecular weight protein-tyrosine-phosphatase [Porphyromonas uenonis]|uniref:low molecular weight protein-tyrosine-phosphatase n=1 Tax=Porphyromonas uenonis TaxID=281920 RepID=UPI0026F0C9C2|nr:low molecular weight protein-tyrosine-phosphatase [Porphyromonas uenonis]
MAQSDSSTTAPYRILFVCLGNICRSPLAEAIMRQLLAEDPVASSRIEVDSAGIGGWHQGELADPRMRAHAARRGIEMTHRARQVTDRDFDTFDLIIAMDDGNYEALRELAPTLEQQAKVVRMADYLEQMPWDHIPDPYYGGASGFELVLDLLTEACTRLYQRCKAQSDK